MGENTNQHIELLDATAKLRLEKADHAGGISMESIAWDTPEEKEMFWDKTKDIYTDLASIAGAIFSVTMPEFNQDMIELVSFNSDTSSGTIADHDPSSGLIRISTAHNRSWLDVTKSMAHELSHFAALRKIFSLGKNEVPARVGVSVIGNRVADPDKKLAFEFQQYRGDVFNEALTETISVEMVNTLRDKYDFIPQEGVEPESYLNERRLYSSLTEAITHSWNNPDLREKTIAKREFWEESDKNISENRSKINIVKQRLGWQDTINTEQVDQVFRNALVNGDGLTKVSHLINACLGNNAFQKLWDAKIGELNNEAWGIIRPFSLDRAQKKEDYKLSIGGNSVQIDGNVLNDNIIIRSYQEQDGEKYGIKEIFESYDRLYATPISKAEINLYAEKVNQRRRAIHSEYPFEYKLPIVHEESRNSLIFKTGKPTLDYCFNKLSEALGVSSSPSETTVVDILDTTYTTEYFKCENNPEVLLARVKIVDELNDITNTRYFFVK
ncbi:hypothetical protein KBD75_03870 [Candidatus Woesebacteria bacterium]|nr:hypothetical protein [Candidatus Woesebacteria bacterium]